MYDGILNFYQFVLLQFQYRSKMKNKRIDSYHITNRLLGSGAFSQVYLAHAVTGQKVAVKVIPRNRIKENQTTIFEREVQLLSQAKHQYIVDFVDVKKTQSNFYIFLEYCDGGSLAQYVSLHQRLQEKQALRLFSQLISAMKAMRKSNILHRDLKSANIMLKGSDIKVVDFGLATKFYHGEMLNSFSGTPSNMAPEMLKGEAYNEKAQIYSAGTILYEMLFGALPSRQKKDLQNLNSQENISQRTKTLLTKMLEENPQKRIDLDAISMELKVWQGKAIMQMVADYQRLSRAAVPYIGSLGGLVSMILTDLKCVKEKSVYDFDLDICGKLARRLIQKELNSITMADWIRV